MLRGVLLGFSLLTFSSLAFAQTEPVQIESDPEDRPRVEPLRGVISVVRPAGLLFASFDRNTDYQISLEEFNVGAQAAYKSANGDGSQTLSLIEVQNWRLAVLGSLDALPGNGSFDSNYDNRVTQDEFLEALRFEYDRADSDEDGIVSFSDLLQIRDLGQRGIRGGQRGEGQGARGQGQRGQGQRGQGQRGQGQRGQGQRGQGGQGRPQR